MKTFNCMKIPEYIATYKELLAPLKDKPVTILELGVLSGASLLMWYEYFTHQNSKIIGLDMSPPVNLEALYPQDHEVNLCHFREHVFQYQGQQDDDYLLESIIQKHGPFDIVIDDASHRLAPTAASFRGLKDHVKPGGLYIIEDWGTGYWDPSRGFDGEAYQGPLTQHDAGMVRLIKLLVDEIGANDLPAPYTRTTEWKSLDIRWGQAILRKK